MKKFSLALLVGLIAVLTTSNSSADVVLTDLGANNWRVQLDPLTFSIDSSQFTANRMVIEDFFAANATASGTHISGSVFWSLNGAPALDITTNSVSGVFTFTLGQIDPNDLLFNYAIDYNPSGAGPVSPGDTVTLSADFIFNSSGVPAVATGPFTAHLLSGTSSISTAPVSLGTAIPEPTTPLALMAGATLFAFVRRKRRK